MPQNFVCSSCNGPIEAPDGNQKIVVCSYCGSSVIVPKELRTQLKQTSSSFPYNSYYQNNTQKILIKKAIIWVFVLVIGLLMLKGVFKVISYQKHNQSPIYQTGDKKTKEHFSHIKNQIEVQAEKIVVKVLEGPTGTRRILTFGGKGDGMGLFKDARHIAVDRQGYVYVAEEYNGRVQVFKQDGTFIKQWFLKDKTRIASMTVSPDGLLYCYEGYNIDVYHGLTGELKKHLPVSYGGGLSDIYWTFDDELLLSSNNDDSLALIDLNGKEQLRINEIIGNLEDTEDSMSRAGSVASDGSGNMYLIDSYGGKIFKFSNQGKYINRFGSPEKEAGIGEYYSKPGLTKRPIDIAVDRKGRVYVADWGKILIYDNNGNFLKEIKPLDIIRQFSITIDDEIWMITNGQMIEQWVIDED